jgi:hypothetical protein
MTAMRKYVQAGSMLAMSAALLLAGCGNSGDASGNGGSTGGGAPAAAPGAPAPSGTGGGSTAATAAPAPAPASPTIGGRTGELVNPENETMVFLYYDLAGLAIPLDTWVEQDNRVQFAKPFDKAALRTEVRAELEAGAAAVKNVGFLRLNMNANLSDYDPTYGEFSVRALAPSSVVHFDAFRQRVELRFTNGRNAQLWKVPPEEAQLIRDKVGGWGSASLDVLLRITGVQPGTGGGTLNTEVVEYELRSQQGDLPLGRVQVTAR